MLLVTGATGTTGMEVLRALKARGAEARAPVRDETKAHHLRDLGFEPTTGDLGDPRTLGPALEGVERAYLVSPIGPMQSEFEQAFLESAKEAGVKHVVKLSVIGASPFSTLRCSASGQPPGGWPRLPFIMSITLSGKLTSTPGSSTCRGVRCWATIISAISPTTFDEGVTLTISPNIWFASA